MTCIVAMTKNGKTWIGGDSAGIDGYSLTQRVDPKVFNNNGYLFGFTSSFRMGQLLRYRFEPPRRHSGDDLFEFMATDFVDEVRECLKRYGFAKVDNQVELGGTFLVCVEGRIFKISDDFQVGESIHPFDAVGCGEDIALGALFGLAALDSQLPIADAIRCALEAAETFSSGVRRPFHVIGSET